MEPSLYVAWVKQMAEKRKSCCACEWDAWVKKKQRRNNLKRLILVPLVTMHGAFCIAEYQGSKFTAGFDFSHSN